MEGSRGRDRTSQEQNDIDDKIVRLLSEQCFDFSTKNRIGGNPFTCFDVLFFVPLFFC